MGDVNSINSNSHSWKFLSALRLSSSKTGLPSTRRAASEDVLKAEIPRPALEITVQNGARAQSRTLLNISDARPVLTAVEDSLETILDVLSEMKSVAVDSAQDGTTFTTDKRRTPTAEDNRNEQISARRASYSDRLIELSEEVDGIVRDTNHFGRPLLGSASQFTFVVDLTKGETLELSLESLSAAHLAVAAGDISVSDTESAKAAVKRIVHATTQVQQRLASIVDVRDRLAVTFENLKTPHSILDADAGKVSDHDSAREQLTHAKHRIVQDSGTALLAQANTTANSTMHLMADVDSAAGPFARIYSIDHDGDSAPVTQRRRIMLGRNSERPPYSTLTKRES